MLIPVIKKADARCSDQPNILYVMQWVTLLNLTYSVVLHDVQEHVLSGGHGLMVQGYNPVIKALAKDIDVHLSHRYIGIRC